MKKPLILNLSLLLLIACQQKQKPIEQVETKAQSETDLLVAKSLDFHDAERQFDKATIQCIIRSTTPKDRTERVREVEFNTLEATFNMSQEKDGEKISYSVPIAENITDSTTIARSAMYKNYFRYMLGGASVLADSTAMIQEGIKDTVLYNIPCKQIKVLYEPTNETPTWYFTFNAKTGEMLQNRFVYNEGKENQRGEFINYGPYVDYKGMKMTSKIKWFYLNGDSLATENIEYK